MSTALIYFADDTPETRSFVQAFLENEGFRVRTFVTGDALLAAFAEKPCDLVLLDVMMPGRDGIAVLGELRQRSTVPVIMLTAKDGDDDYCTGLALGADDYVTKPFKANLLVAKVRALLRRATMAPAREARSLSCGNLRYIVETGEFLAAEERLALSPLERGLLGTYMSEPGRLVTRERLLHEVWGFEDPGSVDTRAVDEANRRLRRKLLAAGASHYNQTVWGRGWTLAPAEAPER